MLFASYVVLLCSWIFFYRYEGSSSCRADEQKPKTSSQTIPTVAEPSNAADILKTLFQDYDKRLRPEHGGKPLIIALSLGFLSIANVVEENMEFTGDIYMRQVWNDTRLSFANRSSALILQHEAVDKLWLPDTFFANAVRSLVHKDTRTVVLHGNGLIALSQRITVTAMTPMDFRSYPMDKQVFTLDLYSYGRDQNHIRYRWLSVELLNKQMSEFDITSEKTESANQTYLMGTFNVLTVKFYAKRRLGYYVLRIYFPCTLCTVVSWLSFWMGCEGIGDRVTVGVNSLLSQMFLLGSINEAMPRVSYIKAADVFLIASFAFTFLALVESVLVFKTASRARQAQEKKSSNKMENTADNPPVIAPKFKLLEAEQLHVSRNDEKGEERKWIPDSHTSNSSKDTTTFLGRRKNLGKTIDKAARVFFPLGYIVFIISYFLTYFI